MIIIHAQFSVETAKQQAFVEEIRPLIAASRAEAGNISYDLYKDTEREPLFTMVEVWKDGQAVASHNASEHFTSFSAKAKNFLNAPLDIKVYNGELIN